MMDNVSAAFNTVMLCYATVESCKQWQQNSIHSQGNCWFRFSFCVFAYVWHFLFSVSALTAFFLCCYGRRME